MVPISSKAETTIIEDKVNKTIAIIDSKTIRMALLPKN
jgi:hypothetical protein